MAKTRTQFLCNHCGSVHPKWLGKCPDCGTWDALEEYKAPTPDARADGRAAISQTGDLARAGEALALHEIDEADTPRRPTGIGEFDRILGGGVVPGSAVLVGGEPGIGKSTLLLQVAYELARTRQPQAKPSLGTGDKSSDLSRSIESALTPAPAASRNAPLAPARVLYVTSEESARQTKLRAAALACRRPICSCWPKPTSNASSIRFTTPGLPWSSSIRSR